MLIEKNAGHHVSRALVALAAGDTERARQHIDRCRTLIRDPHDPALARITKWGHLYLKGRRYRESEMWLLAAEKIIERFPEYKLDEEREWLHPSHLLNRLRTEMNDGNVAR